MVEEGKKRDPAVVSLSHPQSRWLVESEKIAIKIDTGRWEERKDRSAVGLKGNKKESAHAFIARKREKIGRCVKSLFSLSTWRALFLFYHSLLIFSIGWWLTDRRRREHPRLDFVTLNFLIKREKLRPCQMLLAASRFYSFSVVYLRLRLGLNSLFTHAHQRSLALPWGN